MELLKSIKRVVNYSFLFFKKFRCILLTLFATRSWGSATVFNRKLRKFGSDAGLCTLLDDIYQRYGTQIGIFRTGIVTGQTASLLSALYLRFQSGCLGRFTNGKGWS
jgi:hypothetical protein